MNCCPVRICWYWAIFVSLVFCCVLPYQSTAQKRNNVWVFGDSTGLNFNTNPVSRFKSKATAPTSDLPGYMSSICDKNGSLMFYTDGHTVWNRDNFVLPVYNKYWPWFSGVKPLIAPYINNDSLYYMFGVEEEGKLGLNPNSKKLIYFTTKMYKAGDVEEVVYPRPSGNLFTTTLLDDASYAIAGTGHCNQIDMWIIGHSPGALSAFLVTKNGVDPTPVVTSVPASVLPLQKLKLGLGNFKISANGERMAFPDAAANNIVVFDFDNNTGKFSNPQVFPVESPELVEDVELSADGNKLFYGSWEQEQGVDADIKIHYLYQLDLNANSYDAIVKSKYRINRKGNRVVCFRTCYQISRTMQLAPDGRIYISRRYGDFGFDRTIDVIEDPSKYGADMGYFGGKINLDKAAIVINYNYIRSSSFTPKENSIQFKKNTCVDQPVEFSPIYNRLDSIRWDFGDPGSGGGNFSLQKKPSHRYPGPGTYIVKAIIYNRCLRDTATVQVVINPDVSVTLRKISDTTLCAGETLEVNALAPSAQSYIWNDGVKTPERIIQKELTYELTATNECSSDFTSFTVNYKDCPCTSFIPNAFTPNYDGINDVFKTMIDCKPVDFKMQVYDRYGGVVFSTNDYRDGWNGRKRNLDLPQGVYVYTVVYKNAGTKEVTRKQGMVTLLR